MPAPKGNRIAGLNVGAMLLQTLHRKRVTHAVLGRRLGRDQSMIGDLLTRSSMQAYLIWELSVALNHNFFADLAAQFDGTAPATTDKNTSTTTEMQRLREENAQLRTERDYLRKAIDMITPK